MQAGYTYYTQGYTYYASSPLTILLGPHEFVEGMKKLALKEPVTEELTAGNSQQAVVGCIVSGEEE